MACRGKQQAHGLLAHVITNKANIELSFGASPFPIPYYTYSQGSLISSTPLPVIQEQPGEGYIKSQHAESDQWVALFKNRKKHMPIPVSMKQIEDGA